MPWVYRPDHPLASENGMVDIKIAGPRHEKRQATYVISDTMDHMKHPATGAMIDSKSKFRAETRASGCVEVGTDPAGYRPKPKFDVSVGEVVNDVKRSIAELRSR
jgi:hypothetical protein